MRDDSSPPYPTFFSSLSLSLSRSLLTSIYRPIIAISINCLDVSHLSLSFLPNGAPLHAPARAAIHQGSAFAVLGVGISLRSSKQLRVPRSSI